MQTPVEHSAFGSTGETFFLWLVVGCDHRSYCYTVMPIGGGVCGVSVRSA
jgi:hypothetical protein